MEKKTLYAFYVFDGRGARLYSDNWNQKSGWRNDDEDHKLMYGMLFSLNSFVKKINPKPSNANFHHFTTSTYRLHCYETPTRLKFIMLTEPNTDDLREELRFIYANIFVEYVIKNPLYKLHDPVESEQFVSHLHRYLKQKFAVEG
eukprot:TRINITY_DN18733_c0_g1_i1.p2 TRINITY_DN18733_c0_g1~~TRINITY_DN18733_c0_g1_i1.p2  ORF type:complete len:145 (+),score=39.22 TRINITY_DN18733_c0_g1_i1:49-483(+)